MYSGVLDPIYTLGRIFTCVIGSIWVAKPRSVRELLLILYSVPFISLFSMFLYVSFYLASYIIKVKNNLF